MKIIYPTDNGISVVHPSGELPIEEVAAKDVPDGVPYLIVADEAIPADRTFRDAWTADFTNPNGFGLGPENWKLKQEISI